jgi:hypothetical protein
MHPILEYLFGWEVFPFGAGILFAAGCLLVADEFKKFTAARILFSLTAFWIIGKVLMWSYVTYDGFYTRGIITFVIFGLVGVGTSEGIRLIGQREAKADSNNMQQERPKKPDVQQSSQGANSPNIVGSGNVVVISPSDPGTHEQLKAIESLLKARNQKDDLLTKYPLGYVVFDVDYVTNAVTPYETRKGLEAYQFDFRPVRITQNTADRIAIRLPDLIKDKKLMITGAETGGWKRVGNLGGFMGGDEKGGIMAWAEILAIKGSEITFLVGFERAPKLPR